ncbi:periphilin-1 [Mastacembelus armatus]|uniref:Periphilin 1 n=1 Tax=Mastacembelus armatus TaxID=205130 RepID=A0A3Q3NLQ0_9TELE|nr:periphilin-1-like [Mastacembelus armatus]
MAYRHGRRSIREEYEECFPAMDSREVTVHRVVNIVERRSLVPLLRFDYDRDFHEDKRYHGTQNFQDRKEFPSEGNYPPTDRRYFDENPNYGSFRRNSSPSRNNDGLYSHPCYSRDDLRHQLTSRKSNRPGPYFRNGSRGSGPQQKLLSDKKAKEEAQPPAHGRPGSNTSNKSFSPDKDKGHSYQQSQQKFRTSAQTSHIPSNSVEEPPQSSGSSKEKTPASVAESEEVVATTSVEPKPTPEEDFKARRLEAIKAKAQEIEKNYRQDCETFRTVVKMLVAKEPSLDNLLQAPLDANLLELKQRCLDVLRHFVKELDEVLEQPDTTTKATCHKTLE